MNKVMRTSLALGLAFVGTAVFVGLGGPATTPQERTQLEPSKPISYSVIHREALGKIKLSYDLRVDLVDERLPTADELGEISRRLHRQEGRRYERMFVVFYLPGMEPGAGGFATAHHNPGLEVKILDFVVPVIPEQYQHLIP